VDRGGRCEGRARVRAVGLRLAVVLKGQDGGGAEAGGEGCDKGGALHGDPPVRD